MRDRIPAPENAAGEGGSLLPLAAVAAALFPLLATLRRFDDNSLASWAWILEGRDAGAIWALHLAALGVAALAARRALPRPCALPAVVAAGFAAPLRNKVAVGEPAAGSPPF